MQTSRKLTTVLGIAAFVSAMAISQSAQAFTMVLDQYTASLVASSGRWISGTVENPATGMTEWVYYYPLQYTNGYAGSDGQWYYVMTFGDVEQIEYISPTGVASYWGVSGNNWDPYAGTGVPSGGTGGTGGGGVIGVPAPSGNSSGVLGIPFPGGN